MRLIILVFLIRTFIFCVYCEDKVVAVVNNQIITLQDMKEEMIPIYKRLEEKYTGKFLEKKKKQLWNLRLMQLIENRLLLQKAEEEKIEVSDEDVDKLIKSLIGKVGSVEGYEDILLKQGIDIRRYRKKVREKLMIERLLDKEIRNKIYISIGRVKEYYEGHKELFTKDKEVNIRNILVSFEKYPYRKAKERIKMIYNKIKNGADFAEMAREYSDGQFASRGGETGFFKRGTYFEEIEKRAFSLKLNQISDIFESPVGFHIIKVIGIRGGKPIPFSKVKGKIRRLLYNIEFKKLLEEYLEKLKKKAYIRIYESY